MIKTVLALSAAVIVAVMAARLTYNATAHAGAEPVNPPWAQNSMQFVAWNGERWTAWIRDGVFELRPLNTEEWSPHAKGSLAFIDWDGRPFQAKIDGDEFLLVNRGNWREDPERRTAIRYRDWEGRKQLRTVAQLSR